MPSPAIDVQTRLGTVRFGHDEDRGIRRRGELQLLRLPAKRAHGGDDGVHRRARDSSTDTVIV